MKTKIGKMPCPDCKEPVTVKKNEHETLSYRCDECDGSGYSKVHELRHARWLANITAAPGAPAPKNEPAPAPAKKSSATIV